MGALRSSGGVSGPEGYDWEDRAAERESPGDRLVDLDRLREDEDEEGERRREEGMDDADSGKERGEGRRSRVGGGGGERDRVG